MRLRSIWPTRGQAVRGEAEQGDPTRYSHTTQTVLPMACAEPGYKSRIQYSDAEYFNLSDKDTRVATAHRERRAPTAGAGEAVIETMPSGNEIERRNRALVAFTLFTGARDSAIASLKLKHLDLREGCVYQDAREVKTKFSKTITTYFFPVGVEAFGRLSRRGCNYLREEKLWGNDDPLFPATRVALGKTRQFEPGGLERTIGVPPRLFGRSFVRRLNVPVCPISIRTACERRWRGLARNGLQVARRVQSVEPEPGA